MGTLVPFARCEEEKGDFHGPNPMSALLQAHEGGGDSRRQDGLQVPSLR